MHRTASQDIAYQEVRSSLLACQPPRSPERVAYEQRALSKSPRPRSKASERDQEGFRADHRVWTDSSDLPEVIRRLGAKAAQREEKLDLQRREEERLAMSEVKAKPKISAYDYKSLSRVPLHLRDYNSFAEKKQEQLKANVANKAKADAAECTFAPAINKKKTEHLRAKTPSELIAWKHDKEMSVALVRMENADLAGSECTFKPEINPKSRRLAAFKEGPGVPLKRTKQRVVEEYLKKEREDLFRPKINVASEQIVRKGYQKPAEIEVKHLKRKTRADRAKSQIPVHGARSATPAHKEFYRQTDHVPTAEEIIERYRKEARPKRRDISKKILAHKRARARSVEFTSLQESPITQVKVLREPKNLGNGRSASKDELREVLKAANEKLQAQRKATAERPIGPKSPSKTSVLEDTLKTQSVSGTPTQASCYRAEREAAKKRAFDNDYWFEYVCEKNEGHLKKQVEKLIYCDAQEKKSPRHSARKTQAARSTSKQR